MGNQTSADHPFGRTTPPEGHPGSTGGSHSHQHQPQSSSSSSSRNHYHNHHSTSSVSSSLPILHLLNRTTGAAGFSKAELDRRCQPSGLYPSCPWDDKAIRRLIGDGKLAARSKGTEQRLQCGDCECPICFLHYAEINTTKCCQAFICTECFLQVRPQRESKSKPSVCPFCNASKFNVTVAKPMDLAKVMQEREQEEQLVIEAKIRARAHAMAEEKETSLPHSNNNKNNTVEDGEWNHNHADTSDINKNPSNFRDVSSSSSSVDGAAVAAAATATSTHAFGSSLEQNERVALLRARSSSIASSSHHTSPGHTTEPDGGMDGDGEVGIHEIAALALTPEERRAIELEMKAQHNHPLAQRLQAEEDERRLHNEREYYRAQANRLRELRARRELLARTLGGGGEAGNGSNNNNNNNDSPIWTFGGTSGSRNSGREWNRLMEALEASSSSSSNNNNNNRSNAHSLDDLVVLEAAIMLSMEEEAARRRAASNSDNDNHDGVDEDGAMDASSAAARSTAGLSPADRDRVTQLLRATNSISESNQDGGTLGMLSHTQSTSRDLRSRRRRGGGGGGGGSSDRFLVTAGGGGGAGGRPYLNHHPFHVFSNMASDTTLDTAALLMRGISEEEQIAMAIAASLEESGPPAEDSGSNTGSAASDSQHGRPSSNQPDNNGSSESAPHSSTNSAPLLRSFSSELNSSRRAMVDAMQNSRRAMVEAVNSTRRAMEANSLGGSSHHNSSSIEDPRLAEPCNESNAPSNTSAVESHSNDASVDVTMSTSTDTDPRLDPGPTATISPSHDDTSLQLQEQAQDHGGGSNSGDGEGMRTLLTEGTDSGPLSLSENGAENSSEILNTNLTFNKHVDGKEEARDGGPEQEALQTATAS